MNPHFRQGVRDARHTLGRAWTSAAVAASLLVLAVAGLLEGPAVATQEAARDAQLRLLGGVVFGLVLPLFAYGVSARLGGSLRELMTTSWPRYGGDRRGYALGRLALAGLLTGLVVGAAGLLALGLGSATAAPGQGLPLSPGNLLAVVWVGLLGSTSYVVGLGVAHLYAGALGRSAFLIGDWLFGSGTSLLALAWPRSYLRALLGGPSPLELVPRDAAFCLVAFALTAGVVYLRRVPR